MAERKKKTKETPVIVNTGTDKLDKYDAADKWDKTDVTDKTDKTDKSGDWANVHD